jgi:hypothetical protein
MGGALASVTPRPCSAASSMAGTLSSQRWPRGCNCGRPASFSQAGHARGWVEPRGLWIGVLAEARWTPSAGLGAGSGTLLDAEGEIGRVSMSVVLVPLPTPAMAAG